ncbi:hypothetical protein Tco_0609376 [Tanacetum coccineum]
MMQPTLVAVGYGQHIPSLIVLQRLRLWPNYCPTSILPLNGGFAVHTLSLDCSPSSIFLSTPSQRITLDYLLVTISLVSNGIASGALAGNLQAITSPFLNISKPEGQSDNTLSYGEIMWLAHSEVLEVHSLATGMKPP